MIAKCPLCGCVHVNPKSLKSQLLCKDRQIDRLKRQIVESASDPQGKSRVVPRGKTPLFSQGDPQ